MRSCWRISWESRMSNKVVGLDGCRNQWCAVVVEDDRLLAVEVCSSARAAMERHPDAAVFAFDIPIGLSATGDRHADPAARGVLPGRTSSVFNAPAQIVLEAETYDQANQWSRQASGKGLSRQSWALVPKIRDVAAVATDSRVYEVHPEVSFWALAGGQPMAESKKTSRGREQRRTLLMGVGFINANVIRPHLDCATDDVLDAMAAAWSAMRIARGEARSLPEPPERLDGRDVAIWY